MTADKPSSFVPKLRFPEFQDAPNWEERELDNVCDILNHRRVPITSSDRKPGPYPYYGASGIVDYVDDYIFDERLVLVGEDGAKWGAFEPTAFVAEGKYWVNNHAHVLRPHATKDTLLANYLTMIDIGEFVTGAAPPKLTLGKLKKIPIPLSPTGDEHEAIADCLGSLDDLIAAEGRKLEALRRHKQGLMQQLFPQRGETVPRLRFSDPDDGSEWQYKVLPEIATNLNNMRIPVTEQERIPGDVPYYGASGIVDYVKDHIFDEDLLCVSEDGANLVARTYPIAFSISGRTWVNNHAHVLRFEKSVTQILVQAYLNYIDISDYITGMAQPKLNRAMLDSIPLALPPTPREQNDVASCIASLDHLLSMHQKKMESLSAHKKGLLQQLFPSQEEEWR